MKDFIKFFSIITGLFRSVISILLLFALGFIVFVDNNLLIAFVDILGVNNISRGLLKPICLVLVLIAFLVNTLAARNIFKAGNDGSKHMSNIFFALVFLAIDLGILFIFRERLALVLIAMNIILLINSLIGLGGKFKGIYSKEEVKKTEYIDVGTKERESAGETGKISLNFKGDDKKLLEKKTISEADKPKTQSSRLITSNKEEEPKTLYDVKKEKEEEPKTLYDVKKEEASENKTEPDKTKEDEALTEKKEDNPKAFNKEEDLDDEPIDLVGEKEALTTNKVIETDSSDETYSEDISDEIKKKEEEKIYDRSKFIKDPSVDKENDGTKE